MPRLSFRYIQYKRGVPIMKLTEMESPYEIKNADILFIALNPPIQSNRNGHYFSGKGSQFYKRLFESGLITKEVSKDLGDEKVFGSNAYNYQNKIYSVIDAVPYTEETDSRKVRIGKSDYENLLFRLEELDAKNIVLMHSRVSSVFERREKIKISYGNNGKILLSHGIHANIIKVPFPNGSSIKKEVVIRSYADIKELL